MVVYLFVQATEQFWGLYYIRSKEAIDAGLWFQTFFHVIFGRLMPTEYNCLRGLNPPALLDSGL
jgi:hypothetical protein